MTESGKTTTTAPTVSVNPYRVTRRVLIIVGSIAAFLGVFIMVGPDDSSVGLGGEVSWEVGDIAPAWGYGLLLGGAAALAGGLILVARAGRLPEGATRNAGGWHDVIAHAVVFLVVNVFVWAQASPSAAVSTTPIGSRCRGVLGWSCTPLRKSQQEAAPMATEGAER